jgi:hypothetical protein
MRSYLAVVASLACMISCGLCVRAAIEEHVAAASPSQVSRPAAGKAEEKCEVLYTSPNGAFRVVRVNVTPTSDDESGEEFWIVSTRDDSQRTKLYSTEITFPTAFYSASGEQWLFVESHRARACNAEIFIVARMTIPLKRRRHLAAEHGRTR